MAGLKKLGAFTTQSTTIMTSGPCQWLVTAERNGFISGNTFPFTIRAEIMEAYEMSHYR